MRVRMIRPSYWTDADLHTRLTAEQREFYIGLWMLADDAGYLAWDVNRVGAELYPYKAPAWRAKRLPAWIEVLGPDHVRVLECGKHIVIPALPRHQSPPKPSYQNQRAHDTCLRQMAPLGTRGDHMAPAGTSTGREGNRREGKGIERGAPPRDFGNDGETGESEFRSLVSIEEALGIAKRTTA